LVQKLPYCTHPMWKIIQRITSNSVSSFLVSFDKYLNPMLEGLIRMRQWNYYDNNIITRNEVYSAISDIPRNIENILSMLKMPSPCQNNHTRMEMYLKHYENILTKLRHCKDTCIDGKCHPVLGYLFILTFLYDICIKY